MTTIAYKDGVIAYDGRVTRGGTIVYDDFDKMRERDGAAFFGAGATGEINELIGAYFGEEIVGECEASVLVLHSGSLTLIGYTDGKLWKAPVLLDRPYAIGSGTDHAYTAFDMGATAYQAIEMAAKRDTGTGGKIRTLTVTKPAE
ncbi:proteasome subunit beta [Pseudomonas chlororaphis]